MGKKKIIGKELKTFDFGRGNGVLKYPWDEWMNGKPWSIEKKDIDCKFHSFRVLLYDQAKRRGLKVKTRITGDSFAFQCYSPEKEATAKS